MPSYPLALPSDEIALVISAIRYGDVRSKRADVAKAIWLIQGYAQNRAFGEPEALRLKNIFDRFRKPKELTDTEAAQHLELIARSPDNAMLGIPWLLLFKWSVKILLAII